MLQKLLAFASIQARIDLVAADYHTGANRFGRINAGDLLEALGEDPGEGDLRQYCFGESYRNDFSWAGDAAHWLQPYVSPERLAELEPRFEQRDRGRITDDEVGLTPHEEEVLQVLHDTRRCKSQFAEFAVRAWSLTATDGTHLFFRAEVGDGGEIMDILSPYELRKGAPKVDGIDFDYYVSGQAAAKLIKHQPGSAG